jgi:hypothetical protein
MMNMTESVIQSSLKRAPRPLVKPAGTTTLSSISPKFAEDEGNEEHSDQRDERQPDVRRATGSYADEEERVDPHHRRQVREPDREVLEEAEDTVELWFVSEALEPSVVIDGRASRLYRSIAHGSSPVDCEICANLQG